VFPTANRNDAAVALEVFPALKEWKVAFTLGDAAYDSEKIRRIGRNFFVSPISPSPETVIYEKMCMVG